MFGKLRQVHWISKVQLSKHREAEIYSCFSTKVEFYNPQDEYDLKKTFNDLENICREREEKFKLDDGLVTRGNEMGEHAERNSLVGLDDVSGLADKSMAFVTFMNTCRKFGYSLLYVFHETAVGSPRWRGILSQAQIFCIFPSTIDLVMNHLVRFADQAKNKHVSRQQLWLTNLVRSLGKKTGYTSFCLGKSPHVSGAARYRS